MQTSEDPPKYRIKVRSLLTAAAICLLGAIAESPPILAKNDCNHPTDFAQGEKCFLAQFPCEDLYFGNDGTPDYAKALRYCAAHNSGAFVALMYLNGEGTPRDLKKAEAALEAWKQKSPDQFNTDQAATLEKAINRCRRDGKKACPRVDYCEDLAEATLDLEICDAVEQLSAEAALSRTIARVRSSLSAGNQVEFDRVVANFKAYQDQEAGRAYDAVGDGMERGLAGTGQAALVRDHFLSLMRHTIEARKLKPATISAYGTVSGEAEREFSRNLRQVLVGWQEGLKDPSEKDLWDQDRAYLEDYKKAARESRLQWIKFRDSCVELASSLYRDHAGRFDPALSMKTFVTKLRIAELRYNPIGPESN